MSRFLIRRSVSIFFMLVAISIVTFVLFFVTPTDPARYTCGNRCNAQILKSNRHLLGYDRPLTVQYGKFIAGLFVGSDFPDDPALKRRSPQAVVHCDAPAFGYSFVNQQCVSTLLSQGFPITVSIVLGGFVLWIGCGVGFGILAALRRGGLFDKGAMVVSLVAYSLPTFFVGLTVYNVVAIKYELLPQPQYVPLTSSPLHWAAGLLAPWISLAAINAAFYIRFTRTSMIETMTEDFVVTATSKGLPRATVVFKHGFRAALTPIITVAGLDLGSYLGGAAIIEQVFNLNGVGKLAINAVQSSDLPVIVATVLLGAFTIVVLNFVVDILYAVVDPRVRLA